MSKDLMKKGLESVFFGSQAPQAEKPEHKETGKQGATGGGKASRGGAKKVEVVEQPPAQQQLTPPAAQPKEMKVPFNLQLPASLHKRLSFYADNHAVGRKSSVTKIILESIEKNLAELEKQAGIGVE